MTSAVKNKKWLGYSAYIVLVTVVLLYYLFPAQAVEEFVDYRIRRMNPAFGFKAEKIKPWIPAGLQIKASQIYPADSSAPAVFKADSIYIGPQILKLIRGIYSFDLAGTAYKGDLDRLARFQR